MSRRVWTNRSSIVLMSLEKKPIVEILVGVGGMRRESKSHGPHSNTQRVKPPGVPRPAETGVFRAADVLRTGEASFGRQPGPVVGAKLPRSRCARHGAIAPDMAGRVSRRVLLRRVQPPSIAAGAHESAGHRTGVLAALEYRSSGDERGLVALDTLHEAATAGRHVVDQLGLVEPKEITADQG